MNIFLIAPHTDISEAHRNGIAAQVAALEARGNTIYWPSRDTPQQQCMLEICAANRRAMEAADRVYVIWDDKNQGCLFDLGMAFAMRKPVRAITGYVPRMTRHKSFQNLIWMLTDECGENMLEVYRSPIMRALLQDIERPVNEEE